MSDLEALESLKALRDKVVSQDIDDEDFYEKMDTFIKAFADLIKEKNNGTPKTQE